MGALRRYGRLPTLLLFIWNLADASDIYGNVGDDITFSWMLYPIPSQVDIVAVKNPAGSVMFQAFGTTPIFESQYTDRIVFNGNTTAGQMRFTLKSITTTDAGLYKASKGTVMYPGQTLYVYGKPTRPSVTAMSAPVVNSNLQLNCSTKSTTVPDNHNLTMTYRWNIDGVNISNSTGRYIITGSLITIQNITLYDGNTTVTCTGTEQGGLTSLTSNVYTVNPEYGPGTVTFTPSNTSYSPTELSTIPDITCSADCKPNCNYRWTKDGQVTSHGSGSTLSLKNINRNDTGVYRCTAWNDHGSTNSTDINVDVKYGPGTVTFTPSNTSYSPTELSTIPNITCSADCKPNCNYRWTKDGQVTSHGSGSTLSLRNINRNDTGVYRCTAWNDNGTKNSTDINVDVKYGPGTVTFTPSTTSYSPTELSTIPDITCSADCKPNCTYNWTKDGQVTSHGFGSTLSLRNINRIDTGVYICTAWNGHGTKKSTDINVDVKYGPGTVTFTPSNTSYSPTELSTIPNITCSADCIPNCNYRWTKDGQVTSHGSGSTLSLKNINRNDTGVYRCTAWNGHGTKNSTDINVDVIYGPGASVQLEPATKIYTFIENTTHNNSIMCHADCRPNCTYSWNTTDTRNPLVFGKVNRSQAGTYTCTATNIVSSSTISIILFIQYPSRIIKITSNKEMVKEKDQLDLKCTFDAVPAPLVVWSKDNGTVFNKTSTQSIQNVLTINSANCVDTGNYTCTVDNKITDNAKDFKTVRIAINCAPRLPLLHSNPEPVPVTTGQGLNISTSIIAYPSPNVTWFFNNESIEQNHSIALQQINDFEFLTHFSKGSLSQYDFGIYTIIAKNGFGKTNASYDVQARRKPDPATDILVACVSSDRANVSFIPGFNGGAKQTFSISFSTNGKSQTKEIPIDDTRENTTFPITNLLSKTVYVFKIISINEHGQTESTEDSCLTKEPEETKHNPPTALIGGVTGTVLGLIVITGAVVTVLLFRRKEKKGKENNDGLRLRSTDDDEDEMRDNILYEPAGPNFRKDNASEASGNGTDTPYSEVGKSVAADVYAQVQKTSQNETSMNADPNAIYSQVQKPKKENGASGAKPKKQLRNRNPNSDMVYENYDVKPAKNLSTQQGNAKNKQKVKPPTAKKPVNRNKDRLAYADLVFAPPGSGKAFVIHGLENRTNYVDIDFSKKAEPLPPENGDGKDDKTVEN